MCTLYSSSLFLCPTCVHYWYLPLPRIARVGLLSSTSDLWGGQQTWAGHSDLGHLCGSVLWPSWLRGRDPITLAPCVPPVTTLLPLPAELGAGVLPGSPSSVLASAGSVSWLGPRVSRDGDHTPAQQTAPSARPNRIRSAIASSMRPCFSFPREVWVNSDNAFSVSGTRYSDGWLEVGPFTRHFFGRRGSPFTAIAVPAATGTLELLGAAQRHCRRSEGLCPITGVPAA